MEKILIIILFLFLFNGIVDAKVIELSNETLSKIISYDNETLIFSEMPPELESATKGDLLIGAPCDAAPYGFFKEFTGKINIQEKDNNPSIFLGILFALLIIILFFLLKYLKNNKKPNPHPINPHPHTS